MLPEVLDDGLAALATGIGAIVVVEGPAGAGKTDLLAEVATVARGRGFRAFRGGQEPFGPFVPFGPLLDALLDADDPLVEPAELRALLAAATPRRTKIDALRGQIEAAAPVVVIVDDLQWSDDATIEALRVLPLATAGRPVLWVVALRQGYGSRDVAATMRALRDASARRVVLGDVAMTRTDARSVAERVDHLPSAARGLVQLAAVFGDRIGIRELASLLGWSRAELADPLARALASALVVESGGRLSFRDEREREAVERSIPAAVRRGLLRQRVDLELADGATPAAVGPTLAAVAQPGDDAAVAILRRAVRELGDTEPGTAADLGLRAIELAGARTDPGAVLAAETVSLLWQVGRTVEARAVGEAALAGALSPDHEAAIRFALVRMENVQSITDAARQSLRGSEVEGAPAAMRDRLLAAFATSSVRSGIVGDEQLDAASSAAKSPDPLARVTGLIALSMMRYEQDWGEAYACVERILAEVAEHGDEVAALAIPQAWRSWLLLLADRDGEALAISDVAIGQAHHEETAGSARQWTMLRAAQLLQLGRLADAAAAARAALELSARDQRAGDVVDATAWYIRGRVALDRADPATLRSALAQTEDAERDAPPRVRRMAAWLRAVAADAEGDHSLVLRLVAPALRAAAGGDDVAPPPLTFPQDPADEVLLARIALAAGTDDDAVAAAVAALERRAAANPERPSLRAAALQARGLLDGDARRLRAAAQAWAATRRTLASASALEDLGVALAPSDRDAAIVELDAARALYEQAGAERHAGRVRRRLRALGRRLRRVAPVDPAGARIGELTAAETAVARLVAEGATNRQVAERLFLSPHTVSSHLRQVYAKLGIRSRGELAERLAKMQKTLHA